MFLWRTLPFGILADGLADDFADDFAEDCLLSFFVEDFADDLSGIPKVGRGVCFAAKRL